MKSLMVTFKGDEYVIEFFSQPRITRYFNDTTLPDEVKHKLGLLMFGVKDSTVGWRGGYQSDLMLNDPDTPRSYVIRVSEDTYEHVIGRIRRDTRSQGESQGQKDSE